MTQVEIMNALNRCEPYAIPDCCCGCPYNGCWDTKEECVTQLHSDTYVLLKGQEPRLLTLEEISAIPTDTEGNAPVWMETRIMNNKGVLTYFEASILWFVDDGWWRRFDPVRTGWEDRKADTYGITWRCWTSPPDEKTRSETPWDV